MVKDIKYIIKRILIGVGVIMILSFLRGNLLISAKALEPINVSPNGMCWYSGGVAPNGCYLTPTQFNISWTTFYGNQFGADGSVERFFWRYHGSNIGGKYYNIDLLFYNGDKSSYLESNRGYIQNSVNNTFSCRIDNTRWGQASADGSSNASSTGTATVHCDNVYLSDDYFTFWFVDGSKRYQSIYAVTDATLTPNSEQSIIDSQNQNTQDIIDSQNNINNSINDSTTDAPNNDVNSMNSKVASNNSITQLLTLPITLFQNVLNNINGSCSSYNLGALYGHNLTLPCINLGSILGSTLWGVIDVLISGLFILSFRKKMVDIFNHMSSLNDRGNELE